MSLPRPSGYPNYSSRASTVSGLAPQQQSQQHTSAAKTRQYAHLHSQLAQLNANLADTENLVRMTAVQAGDIRFLGGYVGALFMGAAKVLGEEGVRGNAEQGGSQRQSDDDATFKEEDMS
ncbi:hypothetical protein KEM55_001202 [Ascosphaera atra]|nr:hypothetical protein KEM55_001202 [Ascosphaera atra]